MSATKTAAAARAAVRSSGPGLARSGDSLASIGRPGFISGLFRRHVPSDRVAAHPVRVVVRGTDQDLVRAPERWGSGLAPERRDSELAREPSGQAKVAGGVQWS